MSERTLNCDEITKKTADRETWFYLINSFYIILSCFICFIPILLLLLFLHDFTVQWLPL